jgi:uncharacterized membrane protein YjdF
MNQLVRRFQLPIVAALVLAGCAFLLKMCYLSLTINTVFGIIYLTAFYGYVRARYNLVVPPVLLALVMLGVEVDALGNHYRVYDRQFGPLRYDEFAHLTIQVLVTPIIIWLMREVLERTGHQLSLGFTTFFAATSTFSLSAFYEIIELWDELYFNGHRIWSFHDTANDLQFDLCGIIAGALLAYALLRRETARFKSRSPLPTSV